MAVGLRVEEGRVGLRAGLETGARTEQKGVGLVQEGPRVKEGRAVRSREA